MTRLNYIPILFSSALLALAFMQVILAPASKSNFTVSKFTLAQDEMKIVELSLKPGDRYIIGLETTGLSDLYVLGGRDAETFKKDGSIPSTATGFHFLKTLTYALPSQTGGTYLILVKQREAGEVTLRIEPGLIDDATRKLRSGKEVLRNSFESVLPKDARLTLPVYQFIPGTKLHLNVEGDAMVALLDMDGFYAYSKGRKQLSDLCKTSNCLKGSGSLSLDSEDFVDLYLVAEDSRSPTKLSMQVIATEKMLFYVGTCS